jgi:hypothetical protein
MTSRPRFTAVRLVPALVRSLPAAHQEPHELACPAVGGSDVQTTPDHGPEQAPAELGLVHDGQRTFARRAP